MKPKHNYLPHEQIGLYAFYIKDIERGKNGRMALFNCICGKEFKARIATVKQYKITSCGCKNKKCGPHGREDYIAPKSSEYNAWIAMKARCYNPKLIAYKNYGGRGIIVCERWRNSYKNFLEDMGTKPTPKHSLDRHPNKNGNYEPGNCRWATSTQQNRNSRRTIYLTYNGIRYSLPEFCEEHGLSRKKCAERLRWGWTIDELFLSVKARRKSKLCK